MQVIVEPADLSIPGASAGLKSRIDRYGIDVDVLVKMVRRKIGDILLIASILGYQPTPGYAVYGATKAYVLPFGESLHADLKKYNVNVTVLSPGPTETSFAAVAGQRNTWVLRDWNLSRSQEQAFKQCCKEDRA